MNGSINEAFTAGNELPIVPKSMIEACNGGNIDPPRMAMISPAAPNLASSPIPFNAIPYIVGNISDMHAETATRLYNPQMFWKKITPNVNIAAAMASIRNSFPGLRNFNR